MSTQKTVMVGDVPFGGDNPIAFIMGPCQLENRDHAMMMAERVANACATTRSKFVFKTSYDKANRSSITSARGIGMDEGLRILGEVRDTFGCPVITDVHEASSVMVITVDFLQKLIAVVSILNLELMLNLYRTITLFREKLARFVGYTSRHHLMLKLS
jgi:3-deoxy-D-manno-octulosonic acid (KDO) 8-phosphate synthase